MLLLLNITLNCDPAVAGRLREVFCGSPVKIKKQIWLSKDTKMLFNYALFEQYGRNLIEHFENRPTIKTAMVRFRVTLKQMKLKNSAPHCKTFTVANTTFHNEHSQTLVLPTLSYTE